MICSLDIEKRAIRDHSVFGGLCMGNSWREFKELFLRPEFLLLEFEDGQGRGHVIFEENNGGFIFHLVNFTKMKTQKMTENFITRNVIPYCKTRMLSFIQARVERKGMGRKLSRLGFVDVGNNIYRRDI